MSEQLEQNACTPTPLDAECFNPNPTLPYGLTVEDVAEAMQDFLNFLGFVNTALYKNDIPRFETIAMPANMSSIVGEFLHSRIPKYCDNLEQNGYHNGHPDMVPSGQYPNDSIQYGDEGIEVKASRYGSGWQGHNVEECWLMVFHYDANNPNDDDDVDPFPFLFKGVYIGELEEDDWSFSGRSGDSRRTITASVLASGRDKMKDNYIYDITRSGDKLQLDIFDG